MAQELPDIKSLKQGVMSTAKIMVTLYRAAMNIPENVSDKDPALINGVLLDSRVSGVRQKLTTTISEYTQNLNQLSGAIQTSLNELGKSKTTLPLRDNYNQEHAPLKETVAGLSSEHDKLAKNLLEIIEQQQKSIPELFKQLSEGKISKKDLIKNLQPYMSKQDNITLSAVKLESQESDLWNKLESLYNASSQAAAVATGARIEAPARPDEPRRNFD